MNNDTNSLPIESKLSTFFDKERAETHAPVDLFDRIEGNLTEQDSGRRWTRVFSIASGHSQMVGLGIVAALVIALGASTVLFSGMPADMRSTAQGEAIYDSRGQFDSGQPGVPGTAGVPGAPGAPGAPAIRATPAQAEFAAGLSSLAGQIQQTAAVQRSVSADTVVQTVVVEKVVTEQVVQTVVITASGDRAGGPIAAATATPTPRPAATPEPVPLSAAQAAVLAVIPAGGYGITQDQYDELLRQALAGELVAPSETPSATFFENYGVNPFVTTLVDPITTFAMDVDTASYTLTRGWLNSGNVPPPDAIRVEEFVNYFDQD
jgi:hypothetical protein